MAADARIAPVTARRLVAALGWAIARAQRDAASMILPRGENQVCRLPDSPVTAGATSVVAAVRGDTVIVANAGDSRAVLCNLKKGANTDPLRDAESKDLTEDQKPDTPAERKRIVAAGGYVSKASPLYGPARVWIGAMGIGPGLAMSRSLGDHAVADIGVHAEPEVHEEALDAHDRCLILASDGVWEFLTNENVARIVWPFYCRNSPE